VLTAPSAPNRRRQGWRATPAHRWSLKLSRASDVLSGCSYGTILRRLHAGGGISVPTTPSHTSSSTAAALGRTRNWFGKCGDTPRWATRWPRLRLCFRTAGSGMHHDDFRPQSSRLAWFQASHGVQGSTSQRADLQRRTKGDLCGNPNWPMIPSVCPPQTTWAGLHYMLGRS